MRILLPLNEKIREALRIAKSEYYCGWTKESLLTVGSLSQAYRTYKTPANFQFIAEPPVLPDDIKESLSFTGPEQLIGS